MYSTAPLSEYVSHTSEYTSEYANTQMAGINHFCKQFDLRSELIEIGKKKSSKGGKSKPLPALTRNPVAPPDSSDEEEERERRLGAAGV